MSEERTVAIIRNRFAAERANIVKFIEFVRASTDISDGFITEINSTLQRSGLRPLPIRPYDRWDEPYSPEEIDRLLVAIREVTPDVQEAVSVEQVRVSALPHPISCRAESNPSAVLSEWVEFMMRELPEDATPEDVQRLRVYAANQARTLEDGDTPAAEARDAKFIDDASAMAVLIHARGKLGGLEYALERFEMLQLIGRAASPHAEINVLRQGFLLLMTAFDAAVFDLVRVALSRHFFLLIGKLGKQETISLELIGSCGSFEEFRERLIEDQLKKRYVKDLLYQLKELGVKCVDEVNGDKFVQLIELVLRRNIHVHNRGVVDERYLERSNKGVPRFNLYNLNPGDIAFIDDAYWDLANRLCDRCIQEIADWADAGV